MRTLIGCSVVIYDDEDRILISKRSKIKKQFPLMWEIVGGALENNETPDECINREVREEISCKLYDLKLLNVYTVNDDNGDKHVLIVYTAKIEGDIKPNCEIERVKWIKETELDSFDFAGNDLDKIKDYFKSLR